MIRSAPSLGRQGTLWKEQLAKNYLAVMERPRCGCVPIPLLSADTGRLRATGTGLAGSSPPTAQCD